MTAGQDTAQQERDAAKDSETAPAPRAGLTRFEKIAGGAAGILLAIAAISRLTNGWRPSEIETIYASGLDGISSSQMPLVQVAAEALADDPAAMAEHAILQGWIWLRNGQLTQAANAFRLAIEDPKTTALAHALAGEALYRNRQFADSVRVLTEAIRLDDSLTDAHRWLAAVLYDLGTTERAVKHLRIVAEQAPDDPRPHRLMGLIFKDMESFEKAIPAYQEALRLDSQLPDRQDVLLELAQCLAADRRYQEMDDVLKQCDPSSAVRTLQADSLFNQGDLEAALDILAAVLAAEPENLEALLLKGSVELASADASAAKDTFQRAVEAGPFDYRAHYKLAQALNALNQEEPAARETAEAERLRDLRNKFSELHARASVDTTDAELRYRLGLTAAELGLDDLARGWFSNALAMDANHVGARNALQAYATQDTTEKSPESLP